jgi:hypothetical protein
MTARRGKEKEKKKKVNTSTIQVEEGVRGYECT